MRYSLLIVMILAGLFILSCTSDSPTGVGDDGTPQPPALSTVPDLSIPFPETFPPGDYYTEEVEYQEEIVIAYPLEQFIPVSFRGRTNLEDPEDIRSLYAYHVVAADFDPRSRAHIVADLHWSIFSEGHYLPEPIDRVFFGLLPPNLGAYNVRNPEFIHLYRKIDVIRDAEEPVMFETEAMEKTTLIYNDQPVEAIPLSDFITEYITKTPGDYSYLLTGLSGQQYSFSREVFQTGYYLPGSELTIFLSPNVNYPGEEIIISRLYSIELHAD